MGRQFTGRYVASRRVFRIRAFGETREFPAMFATERAAFAACVFASKLHGIPNLLPTGVLCWRASGRLVVDPPCLANKDGTTHLVGWWGEGQGGSKSC